MKKIALLLLLALILVSSVSALEGKTTLLTVAENENESVGGTAELFLEVKPGTGRIFIDSFPLTKIDTQISTRFAKEVACDFLEVDCSDKDFFYTIRTKSSVVGGPSAGAGITLLTISVLDNIKLDKTTVITGTINSGGIIGPVSGLKEKAEAAKKEGFTKVLVPKRSLISIDENTSNNETGKNYTIQYADSLKVEGVQIIPVSTLEEALHEFTGKEYENYDYNISISKEYQKIMGKVANSLCERYSTIYGRIPLETRKEYNESLNSTDDAIKKAKESIEKEDFYSAASYCFTANSVVRKIEYSSYTNESLLLIKKQIEQEKNKIKNELKNKPLNTLSNLETYIIVSERLLEVENLLENETEALQDLGYINERLESVKAWSEFFNFEGKKISLDKEHLSNACLSKIAEAEERLNYLDIITGVTEIERKDLEETRNLYKQEEYAFCLFKATKVKADANAVLSTISITNEKVPELIDDQLKLARIQINKQKESFPILGYSYYNYANTLRETRPELSIIFSEYASEFSNLDMYFPKGKKIFISSNLDFLKFFTLGFVVGAVAIYIIFNKKPKKKRL